MAIIGSRTPPPEAARFAYELARTLGEPVIAGLAPGIDAAAHRGALAGGVPTVAFVAFGFGATDPPEFAELETEIVACGGAVATLLEPGTPPSAQSRIDRDRLQAEYSRAIVLVCSEVDGGAIYTVRFAAELAKTRFAVTPPSDDPIWAGNRVCFAEGALPLPFDVEAAALKIRGDRDVE